MDRRADPQLEDHNAAMAPIREIAKREAENLPKGPWTNGSANGKIIQMGFRIFLYETGQRRTPLAML